METPKASAGGGTSGGELTPGMFSPQKKKSKTALYVALIVVFTALGFIAAMIFNNISKQKPGTATTAPASKVPVEKVIATSCEELVAKVCDPKAVAETGECFKGENMTPEQDKALKRLTEAECLEPEPKEEKPLTCEQIAAEVCDPKAMEAKGECFMGDAKTDEEKAAIERLTKAGCLEPEEEPAAEPAKPTCESLEVQYCDKAVLDVVGRCDFNPALQLSSTEKANIAKQFDRLKCPSLK
jgi:hypothetical protein